MRGQEIFSTIFGYTSSKDAKLEADDDEATAKKVLNQNNCRRAHCCGSWVSWINKNG